MNKKEFLNDEFLKNVTGGVTPRQVARGIGIGVSCVVGADLIAASSCLIASQVYFAKMKRAEKHGEDDAVINYGMKGMKCINAAKYMTVIPAVLDYIENS